MKYTLPEETINKTLAYLGQQPYQEVAAIIAEIKQNAVIITTVNKKGNKK